MAKRAPFFINIAFSRTIRIESRLREFNFRKVPGATAYHVDVPDERLGRIMFQLTKSEIGWQIDETETLPDWVYVSVEPLSRVIQEHESASTIVP